MKQPALPPALFLPVKPVVAQLQVCFDQNAVLCSDGSELPGTIFAGQPAAVQAVSCGGAQCSSVSLRSPHAAPCPCVRVQLCSTGPAETHAHIEMLASYIHFRQDATSSVLPFDISHFLRSCQL